MSTAVAELLNTFELLSESQKHEAAKAILNRVYVTTSDPLSDEDLALAANDIFLMYDEEESRNAKS